MAQQSVRGDGLGQVLIQPQYNPAMARNPRGYITLDPAPMRRRNPAWPWIAGGVVGGAALLGAAAWKCRAHVISDDLINLGEDTVYRRIQYKGCFQNLPYEVIVSMADPKRYLDPAGLNYGMEEEFNAFVLLRSSFSSLKEAQGFGSEDDEENDEDRESNPSGEYAACMNACVSREGCNYRAGKAKAACHQQCQSECRGLAVPKPKPGGAAWSRPLAGVRPSGRGGGYDPEHPGWIIAEAQCVAICDHFPSSDACLSCMEALPGTGAPAPRPQSRLRRLAQRRPEPTRLRRLAQKRIARQAGR